MSPAYTSPAVCALPRHYSFTGRAATSVVQHRVCLSIVAVALSLLVLLPFTSSAQTATGATWDNTGTEWTSGTSWVGDNAPTNDNALVGNIATFSNAAAGFNTVNLSSGRGIYGLVFVSGANAYTFTGSALTVGNAGGISNASVNLQTFSNKVINSGGTAIYGSYGGGSLIFAGGIDLTTGSSSASRTVTLGGSGDITVSGAIAAGGTSTGGNILVTNTGLTILSGNNTYFGTTTVNNGARLRLGSATALGATNGGTIISSGGALDLNGQAIGAEALTISGTGVSSNGVIFNSSASAASWSGNIAPTADSTIKATNGSITLSGGININNTAASSRTLTLDGTGGLILSGNISNSFAGSTGNIAIAATASNVTLSGSNSYSGTTTLNGGGAMNINSAYAISTNTLSIGTSAFLNNTSGGAITNLGNNNITLLDTLTFGTSGSTAANSLNLGTGTVTASSSRTITIAGTGVTLGLGTLDSTSASASRSFTASGAGNTLSLAGWKISSGSTANVINTLAGTANWTIGGPIVNGNAFSNGVQIDATGLTTFGGNNTYDGTTIVSSNATLRITSATGLGTTNTGTTVSTGGQLQLSGGITVDAGEALTLNGGTGAAASLRNISGDNLYNGAITFAGTNRIDSDAGTLTLSSFANTLSTSKLLLVGGAGNTIFTGRFTGTGSSTMTKDGAGTLTLSATNFDIGGGVFVNAGTLALGTNDALGATRAVAVNGGTVDIAGFNNTVGAVSLTNGNITGTTGVLTGTSYAVENGTISANLGGTASLTKAGNGTVTLSGNNTYSESVTVSAGALTIASATALGGTASGTTVGAGGQLQLSGGITVTGEALTLNGGADATASLRNITGNNAYNGAITFGVNTTNRINSDAGTLTLSSFANGLASTRWLYVGGSGNTLFTGRVTGSGNPLTKDGSGTLTLAGTNNDLSGGVLVNAGTLALATNDALGATRAVAVNGGTVDIAGFNNTVGAVSLTNGSITGTTGVLTGTSYAVENGNISANLGGSGALTKSSVGGVVMLSGSNNYNGATTIGAGILRLGQTNALSASSVLLGSSSLANNSTLELSVGGGYGLNSFGSSASAGGHLVFTNSSGSAATMNFTAATNYVTLGSGSASSRTVANVSPNLTLTFNGAVDIGSSTAGNVTFNATGNIAVNGEIFNTNNAGMRGLTKSGSGTLTLAGANTYNGATTISAGTLQVGNGGTSGALGTNTVSVATNSLLVFNRSDSFTVSNAISGAGSLTKSGNGMLTLAGANTYTGGTLIGSGVLAGDTTSLQGSITNNTTLVFNQTTNGINSSAISGIGEVVKEGSGAVELGANTYSGGTLLNGGAIYLGANTALGTGAVTIGNGTILASVTSQRTLANNLVAAGNFTLGNSTQATTFNGSFDLGGATRTISLDNSATFNGLVSNGGLIITNINATNTRNFTLAASNTFGGGITLNSGNLRLGHVNAAGTGSITQTDGSSEVQIRVTGTITNAMNLYRIVYVNDSELSGALTLNNTVFDVNANITATNSGVLSGTGGVDKIGAGTLILSGSNTYGGGTSISNGAVAISADNNLGAVPGAPTAGNLTLDGGKLLITAGLTLDANRGVALGASGGVIEVASAQSVSYGGVVAGAGGFTKSGGGSFTFSGANTFSGGTAVSAGTLELANTSGAALGSTASVSVASGATLLISQNNQVNDTASVSLSGGTIQRAGGVNVVFGNLSVSSASFLDFGTGATGTMSFGTYTGSALLTINNFGENNALTFGQNFTSAQLAANFSFDNSFVTNWNGSTFTITAIPETSTYIAAIGLLGLMIWPSRRRLLKDAKSILGLRAPSRDRLTH